MSIRLLVILLFLPLTLFAQIPNSFSYQGFLADEDDKPLDGTHQLTFSIYDTAFGGHVLWSDSFEVDINSGLFSVQLGRPEEPISADLFNGARFLGVTVGDGIELSPRHFLTSVPTAIKAEDANTVGGKTAGELDQSGHTFHTSNPHAVTAAQTGAVSVTQLIEALAALQPYRFVGISTASRAPDSGYGSMNEACQLDFGSTARMCSIREYIDSPVSQQSDETSPLAWINPSNVGWNDSRNYSVVVDSFAFVQSISCFNWSETTSTNGQSFGATVTGKGSIKIAACNSNYLVTCCTPNGVAGTPVSQ